jgi:hypothetical protein
VGLGAGKLGFDLTDEALLVRQSLFQFLDALLWGLLRGNLLLVRRPSGRY